MITTRTKHSFYIHLLAIFFSLPFALHGQPALQYDGEYQVGDYLGEASFSYTLVENDTILNGPFQMQRSNLDKLLEQEDSSFAFLGAFQDNYPEGNWHFRFGAFQSEKGSQLVDFQYRVSVSGVQQEGKGAIKKGKPHGRWVYSVDSIVKSEVDKTLFRSTIDYEDGIPQKSFRIENDQYTLLGRCLRNGLAHDQWALYSIGGELIESWYFDSGVLKRIETQEEGRIVTTDIYKSAYQDSVPVHLDNRFYQIVRIKGMSPNSANNAKSKLYELLVENDGYYRKIDDILSDLGESEFRTAFQVKVESYSLKEFEIKQIDSIINLHKSIKLISESLLNDTQLNIIRLSDEEAAYYYNVVDAISSQFVEPITSLVDFKEQQIINAISRVELFNYLWPGGVPTSEIELVQNEVRERQTFKGPNADSFDFSEKNFLSVLQMATYANECLESVQEVLGAKLNIEKRQQELIQIEEQLIAQSKKNDQLVDSLRKVTSGKVRETLDLIKTANNEYLSAYAAIENKEEKLEYGRQLLECLIQIENLTLTVGDLPVQWKQIQEVYMDDIWNPHMAVIMKDAIKKRITSAYDKIVIPGILEKVQANLNCDNVETYALLMKSLYQRMLEMRDEDTSKLERKLRKETDTKEILQLFNVEPIYTD